MKQILVAYEKNRGIGADNDLLWQRDLPADLKHFKDATTDTTVIMGRKTFESIGRPLPNRQNIVISRTLNELSGIAIARSLKEAYELATHETISIIGGAQVYAEALDSADTIMATEVEASFPEATVFFPAIDPEVWHEASREHHDADESNKYSFDFVTYRRS